MTAPTGWTEEEAARLRRDFIEPVVTQTRNGAVTPRTPDEWTRALRDSQQAALMSALQASGVDPEQVETMAHDLAVNLTRAGWGLIRGEEAEMALSWHRAASAATRTADQPSLKDALAELIRVSKSAGMNAASDLGYLPSTRMADEEEISEVVQEVYRVAAALEAPDGVGSESDEDDPNDIAGDLWHQKEGWFGAAPEPVDPLPDGLDVERVAAALKAEGFVRGVASRYGSFNDPYWEQSAEALIARLSESGRDPGEAH